MTPTGARSFPKQFTAYDQHEARHYSGEHVQQELLHRNHLLCPHCPRKDRVGLGRLPRQDYTASQPCRKRGFFCARQRPRREVEQDANAKLAEARALNSLAERLINQILQMVGNVVKEEGHDKGGSGDNVKKRGRTPKNQPAPVEDDQAAHDPPSMRLPGLDEAEAEEAATTA